MTRCRWLALFSCLALGCTDVTTELVPPAAPATHDAAAEGTDSGPQTRGHCGNRPCECDDQIDQDGDGLVDGLDPECTGPFDDDESSFATGMAGGSLVCQDCYWDDNFDSDDDGCAHSTNCLFEEVPGATAPASCATCEVSTQCQETCRPSTPNGCDCFGCCAVSTPRGDTVHVLLSDSCSLRDVQNEEKCPRCMPSQDCTNPCGTCELCPGRKRKDLPVECRGQGMPAGEDPMNVCEDEGQAVCSETQPCPRDYYCQLGCCLFVLQ